MFELMDIADYTCKDVVEPSYKKKLGQIPTMMVTVG